MNPSKSSNSKTASDEAGCAPSGLLDCIPSMAEQDAMVEFLTWQELSVLDEDLAAPWRDKPWRHIHSDKLVKVQLCRLLRELISMTKEGNNADNQ